MQSEQNVWNRDSKKDTVSVKKNPIPKKPNEKIVKINTPVKRGTKRKHPEDETVNIHSGVPFPSRPKPASKTRTLKDRKKGSVSTVP